MTLGESDTRLLLRRVREGDQAALKKLLEGNRDRLKRMVTIHMDRPLARRFDPSDVVQEALAEAVKKLPDYLRRPRIAFYPWLRTIAWEKLVKLRQQHVAQKRSVRREQPACELSDGSLIELADRFVASGTQPSERLIRQELHSRVRAALARLSPREREVLVLRYLESLSTQDAIATLGISRQAFAKRHLRAIRKLRGYLGNHSPRGSS
jgi:RNA polymerase sigma-70 factor (ECF subfamily)